MTFDITMDLAGTFNKDELIQYMTNTLDFRMQRSREAGSKTIVDNDITVGRNCLCWMETIKDKDTEKCLFD